MLRHPALVVAALIVLAAEPGRRATAQESGGSTIPGRIEERAVSCGTYFRYVPTAPPDRVLVVVHGTVGGRGSALDAAATFIQRWTEFAETHRLAVVAPAFDQERYGGRAGPGGGYRGLFGRDCGADEFVHEIVADTLPLCAASDGRFLLYGHSAGGQFASRYVVRHPERVYAAVIGAAGTYAFPDPDVPWTNGMAPLSRHMSWGEGDPGEWITIRPDPLDWARAAALPITVVVGSRDRDAIDDVPGQRGADRVERGRAWVEAMREHARAHGDAPLVRFVLVEDVGHDSRGLTPAAQQAFVETAPHAAPPPDDAPPGDAPAREFVELAEGQTCGDGRGRVVFLVNEHPTRMIVAHVRKSWTRDGEPRSVNHRHSIRPRSRSRRDLGCSVLRLSSGELRRFEWTIVDAAYR